jgi:hypothetical protein
VRPLTRSLACRALPTTQYITLMKADEKLVLVTTIESLVLRTFTYA